MSIKSKFEKIDLEKLKSESPQAYGILNGWANSTKNFTDEKASEVVEPLFNKLYDKLATGKLWYVIEGNKQPKDQVAEPVTKKEEETIVKQVVKSEPKEPKVKATKTATKTATKKTHTSNANKVKHVPTPPKLGGKSVFEVAKELREKDPTLKQRDAVRMAGKMVKDAHNKAKDEELQSLMKMIKSDPRYSVLRPDKNTSIIRDLGRPAIRTTKRVSRKGWKNQYGASDGGRTYYENRVNRMDVDKVPMYAKGGETKSVLTAYANGDYDKKIKDFNSLALAKNFAKLNKNNYDSIMFEDEFGDNIYVSKDDTIKDIEDLFAESFAKGGRTHGSHLPTSDVEYFRKGKIDKLMIGGKEISEDDILSGVFAKKFAKGGEVVGDYSILAYKTKDDYKNDTDERYFGMSKRSLDYVIDEFDSRVDSGLFYGYKITKGGDFANVIYQSSRDSKGGVSKRLEKTGKDYRVLGYKTKADFNNLDNEKYSGVTDRSLEYTKNLFDEKIKSGMWYGYQIFESGDMRNPIYTNTKDGEFAKGGKVYNRSWHQDHYNVNKSEKWEKQGDSRHGETARNRKVFAKGGKVAKFDAYEVQEKIADLSYKVWNDLGINSGSEIYESDAVQKKMASAYEKAGIDDLFTQYSESERKEIAEALTDENQHSMRQYLSLRGYLGEAEKQDYIRLAKNYNVGGRKSFLEPRNIKEAKTTSTPKSGGKQGYIYVPKEDITSIEYMKDGESVIAKNSDILDGAYIKLSSSSFAEGGRLPKGEVMYVPKKDIEDIIVVDSGFKANNITDELLSGIHIKATALSKQPASQSTPSKGAKFGTTRIYKGYRGWVGRTSVDNVDGNDYEIVTMKRSNGKLWSNAQKGKNENGIFSYMVFGDENTSLIETNPAKVTEKVVSEQHDKAVAKFKEMKGL
jgi:hypothetical protein